MRSFDDGKRSTLALYRGREDERREPGAEVIDLVYLPTGARPQPRAELEFDEVEDARVLTCGAYNDCLAFVAAAHWRGFHCRRCPRFCGEEVATRTADTGAATSPETLARVIHFRR